jgi:hypothetical protein
VGFRSIELAEELVRTDRSRLAPAHGGCRHRTVSTGFVG